MMNEASYGPYSRNRGIAQPLNQFPRSESAEDRKRRLHREAAEDVKRYKAALREAKERYAAYDPGNLESQLEEAEQSEADEVDAPK
jgi:hypothetical protein